MKRAGLAATIKARWICEQAHQQLKEKLGLDHFEGRSWQGLHRHALMTMIAYAFLQHRHLTQVGRKKESTDRRLSLACRPYATPSSISFFDHYLSNAHTAEDEAVKNSGVGKSAKVVLVPLFHHMQAHESYKSKAANEQERARHNEISFECMTWHAHLENVLNRLK
jgi:Transposase DDE domain